MRPETKRGLLLMKWLTILLLMMIFPMARALQITEIMYDHPGGDEGYEWIEIYNAGDSVDLCEYKFYEAETNHKIKADDCNLNSGEYAIIADVAANLDFDTKVFDSSWGTLKNKGEELCIRDSDKNDLDCVDYSDTDFCSEGSSIQLVNGEWCSNEPTPGKENSCPKEEKEEPIVEEKTDEIIDEVEEPIPEPVEELHKPEPIVISEPEPEPQPVPQLEQQVSEEEPIEPTTGKIVYQTRAREFPNLPLLMVLFVSILLNVFLLIYTLRRK